MKRALHLLLLFLRNPQKRVLGFTNKKSMIGSQKRALHLFLLFLHNTQKRVLGYTTQKSIISSQKIVLHNTFTLRAALFLALFGVYGLGWGQVNITPIRTDVTGFGTWTDTNVSGTVYLQLITSTSKTITPAMNFDNYSNETLDFKARTFGGGSAAQSTVTVSISVDNGSNWTIIGTRIPANSTLTSQAQFDLSSYSGTQVKIKFESLGASSSKGFGIDDISISGFVSSSNDQTSKVEAPTTQVTTGGISSTATTSGSAVEVFKFKITDAGTADGLATKVTSVKIKKSSGSADWTNHIAGASLWDGATQITTGTVVITDADITFPITSGNLDISDNSSKELTLKVWLNTTNIVDNATMVFTIPSTSHNFTADSSGSSFATDFGSAVTGNTMTVSVTATKLTLTTQPASTACPNTNITTAPVFKATDANGMVDADFTSQITLSNSGSLGMNNYQLNASAGVATFSTLQFTATGSVTITASASGLTDSSASNNITISVANATSPAATNGNTLSVLTWTNPTCFDELMIVAKAGSAVATTPSGDGTAYTADLNFGTGTAFDGGSVVYKGLTSSQTVSSLTNGTTYYFTLFTRKGTSWSTGITATATPALVSSTTDYFRSKATGNWSDTSTWESSSDNTNWINATLPPTSVANAINILNGHTVTCTASVTVDQLTVETGAILKNNASQTFTIANGADAFDLVVDGTFENAGSITTTGAVKFNANAVYKNTGNGNTIVKATWDADSFCHITGNTSATAITNIGNQISAYGTLIWNCTGQTSWFEMTGSFDVAKDFQINSTGGGTRGINLVTTGTNRTYNIGGNLELNGAKIALSNNSGRATLNIAGNLFLSDSSINQLDMGYDSFNPSGAYRSFIYLSGNLYIGTNATLTCTDNNTHDDYGNIVFEKTGTQTFENKGNLSWINFDIDTGSTLVLNSNLNLGSDQTFDEYNMFSVFDGGILDFNGFNITDNSTGESEFNAYDGCTLKITSPQGISYDGLYGNVLVGYPTFENNINLIYKASGSQNTGDGLPASVNNLEVINNTHLKLTNSSVSVTSNATIESGSTFDNNGENQVLGTGNVIVNGTFITKDAQGFNGTNAAVDGPTITLNAGSTVEYGGASQSITHFAPNYANLKISGTGVKTLVSLTETKVGEDLVVSASTLNIETGKTLSVVDAIENASTITIEHEGSLVQTNDAAVNTGSGTYKIKKSTGGYYQYDYIYWSSPIENQPIQDVFKTVDGFNNHKYQFVPDEYNDTKSGLKTGLAQTGANADGYDDEGNDWTPFATGTMQAGLGYIVMGKGSTFPFSIANAANSVAGYNVEFSGNKVNNGEISVNLSLDKYHLDAMGGFDTKNINLNLVGNPYPSSISAATLFNANSTLIEPNFYFWTHAFPIAAISGPYAYDFSNDSFASATVSGSTVTTNTLATGLTGLNYEYIASGQGFFVQAKNSILPGAELIFNNAMRNGAYPNTSFLKTSYDNELSRIWLSLTEGNGNKNNIAVGFSSSATDSYGINDVPRIDSANDTEFYSLINGVNGDFDIQFMSDFADEKTFPLGMEILTSGDFSISIDGFDGIFTEGQKIYLEDTYEDVIHNLNEGAYSFTQTAGTNINDRFILRFTNSALSNEDTTLSQVKIYPNPSTGVFYISYNGTETLTFAVYDLTGKKVVTGKGTVIDLSQLNSGIYTAQISTIDGVKTTKLVRE